MPTDSVYMANTADANSSHSAFDLYDFVAEEQQTVYVHQTFVSSHPALPAASQFHIQNLPAHSPGYPDTYHLAAVQDCSDGGNPLPAVNHI